MPKCEHGLTSKECYVCASPKHAEQAEKQEPFGYFQYAMHFDAWVQNRDSNKGVAFYTAPQPQREWVGLTDDEMLMIYGQQHEGKKYSLGRMVEQALKEKNNVS